MPAIGSLRVELELEDGSFTTRVIRAGTSLEKLEKQVKGTIVAVRQLDSTFGNITDGVAKFTLIVGLAREAVFNLYTVFGAWGVSILRTAGELERLNTLLQNLSTAADEAGRKAEAQLQSSLILQIAQTAPFALRELTESFVRLRSGGVEPLNDTFRSLVDAVSAFGGTGAQLERASIAIQQISGKGVVSLEELRQQLGEAVPSALPALARGLRVGVDELVREIANGRVRAQPALDALRAEFERTYGGRSIQLLATYAGQVQLLANSWQQLQRAAAGAPAAEGGTGFLATTTQALERLNEQLRGADAQGFAVRVGQALAGLVRILESAGNAVVRYAESIRGLLILAGGFIAFRIAAVTIATLSTALNAVALAATTAVTRFVAFSNALQTAAGAAAILRGALLGIFGVGAVVAIVANLDLISRTLDRVIVRFSRLGTESTGALERVRQGASDLSTIGELNQELEELDRRRRLAITQQEEIRRLQQGQRGNLNQRRANLPSVPGVGDAAGLEEQSIRLGVDPASLTTLQQRLDQLAQIETAAQEGIEERRRQVEAAQARRRQVEAENLAQARVNEVTKETFRIQAAYQKQAEEIQKAINEASNIEDADERADTTRQLQERLIQLQISNYEQRLTIFEAALSRARENYTAALESEVQDTIANSGKQVEKFEEIVRSLKQARDEVREQGQGAFNSGNDPATAIRQAETAIRNMRARTAELNAETVSLGGNLARINTLIDLGRFRGTGAALRDSMREAAIALDEAEKKQRQFNAAKQAQANIETGLDQQTVQLQGYIDRLNDPTLPEAQRKFLEFQRQMAAELDKVRIATNGVGAAFQEAAAKAAGAVAAAEVNAALARVENLVREGEQGRIAALPPGRQRAEEEKKQAERRINAEIASLRELQGRYQESDQRYIDLGLAIRKAEEAKQGVFAGIAGRGDRAEAGGLNAQENQLERLRGRVAELTAEMFGLGGEFAKYNAQLTDAEKQSAFGQSVLESAKAIDELTKKLEIAREGYQALENLQRGIRDAGSRGNEYFSQLIAGGPASDRQFVQQRARIAEEIERINKAIREQQSLGGTADPKLLAGLNLQQEALASQGREYAARIGLEQQDATRQIRASLATTNADRRRFLQEDLAAEINAQAQRINLYVNEASERELLLERLNNFNRARLEQIQRETEGATAQMFRSWSNLTDNIDQSIANAFDQAADALAEFVTTGKADFKALAQSIITDLVRIQIRAAASGIFGQSGVGSGLMSIIGGLFGGGASGGVKPDAGGAAAVGGALKLHEGGLVGAGARTYGRSLPGWLFNGAPRFHKGLMPGEFPAILEQGESVWTRDQMGTLGQAMDRIADTMTTPGAMTAGMPSGGAMGAPPTINLINQSGQDLQATTAPPRMDGEQMVVDIILKKARQPGPLRDLLRSGA